MDFGSDFFERLLNKIDKMSDQDYINLFNRSKNKKVIKLQDIFINEIKIIAPIKMQNKLNKNIFAENLTLDDNYIYKIKTEKNYSSFDNLPFAA